MGAQAGRNGTFGSRDQIWSAESLGSARADRPSHWRSESARAVARGKLYLTIPMVNKIRGFCHELEHLRNALCDTGPAPGAASAFILARLCPFVCWTFERPGSPGCEPRSPTPCDSSGVWSRRRGGQSVGLGLDPAWSTHRTPRLTACVANVPVHVAPLEPILRFGLSCASLRCGTARSRRVHCGRLTSVGPLRRPGVAWSRAPFGCDVT